MIVCPNCNHQNPDGAIQCEACYTPLPTMMNCPSCGAKVQADASFCGQCGSNLKGSPAVAPDASATIPPAPTPGLDIPDLPPLDPLAMPDPLVAEVGVPAVPPAAGEEVALPSMPPLSGQEVVVPPPPPPPPQVPAPITATQLQLQTARLLHVQTDTLLEIPGHLTVVHLGKPNDRIPPNIDVSGFPNSEIVSRIHADIRVEGDAYYLEDVGSSNGTYVNNMPLPMGNRHRLRPGDRLSLGKGDKVTFIFQLS
ncbi:MULTISPECIES: FHA domain-containing protein [unclassified Leptolyngbya]|uniref:FHA domain-containing protein n=1 Tax=unclassified Leptolyngbya TaxID=2650499 RepID=UPI001683CCCB|nr:MULTISPECIES: FHA domain-containing protein [unclassified Leptolyngbya]MBD1913932.1 FHA domain-containing protein [Leptolyngbya sp. FACHB-8]MBD2156575.1 FHA domain-containing protein [Leptolyngbya sp. FACHB-16]